MNDAHLAFEGAVERRVGCGFRASRREGEVREAMRGRDGGDPLMNLGSHIASTSGPCGL